MRTLYQPVFDELDRPGAAVFDLRSPIEDWDRVNTARDALLSRLARESEAFRAGSDFVQAAGRGS